MRLKIYRCAPPPCYLQFEDPVEGLQLLREKLELEMMDACDWATQPAEEALKQAAAQVCMCVCVGGWGREKGGGGLQEGGRGRGGGWVGGGVRGKW